MEIGNQNWYRKGQVAVRNGATEVSGIDTDWLVDGIKAGDIFIRGNLFDEIASVNGSKKLTLRNAWQGQTGGGLAYAIIPRARTTMAADILARLAELLENWDKRETALIAAVRALDKRTKILPYLGICLDANGDIAQGEPGTETSDSVLDTIASSEDVAEMLAEVFGN